ncbi:MAG: prepilin-type N-terminal cleavage/methylation domain-containing protein [Candidatus Staskawiczbacteria bacterium]|nr:prepilin-type N-terminal cleavage/methylation domain-containing protein [Candidatus Staskawiczbacteria bacterium]
MNKNKGFTIIELIVVIAIIAVLAAIVLVNVTQYIAKSRDAAIKGNLATIATNAAVWFDANTTYVGFAASSTYTNPAVAITSAGGGSIVTAETISAFCVEAVLNDDTTWCVDSTGYKGATADCDATADCAAD